MSPELSDTIMFLEYFFEKAHLAMGPADSDIYAEIMEDFEGISGRRIPAIYRDRYLDDGS
jgi:hypothetical protein